MGSLLQTAHINVIIVGNSLRIDVLMQLAPRKRSRTLCVCDSKGPLDLRDLYKYYPFIFRGVSSLYYCLQR